MRDCDVPILGLSQDQLGTGSNYYTYCNDMPVISVELTSTPYIVEYVAHPTVTLDHVGTYEVTVSAKSEKYSGTFEKELKLQVNDPCLRPDLKWYMTHPPIEYTFGDNKVQYNFTQSNEVADFFNVRNPCGHLVLDTYYDSQTPPANLGKGLPEYYGADIVVPEISTIGVLEQI